MYKILSCFLFFCFGVVQSQELNCVVQVNADQVAQTNRQIFKTLEKSLNEFVNNTKWTTQNFKPKERIECSMVINVSSYSSDQFTATIQVQSSRPVFNSTYTTPVFNFNDKDFNFKYVEFESLDYDPNSFDSNLVSVLAFYSYIVIGMDADSFSPAGGTQYYATAQEIASLAQQSGYKGWNQADGNQNRFFLINDLLSNTFAPVRDAMYDYNKGMDMMNENLKEGKEKIKAAVMSLQKIYDVRPNAFLMRVFFDAKADEIQSVFSGGPQIDIADLIQYLNKVSPINSSKWAAIKL
jgi:hypothetical protein